MIEKPVFKFALRSDVKGDKRFIPTRSESKASGWDVTAAPLDRQPIVIKPFEHVKIPLGFRAFCPDGWWFELKPRSSTFAKKNLHSLYGTIDELYEGQLIFACQYIPSLKILPEVKTYADKNNHTHICGMFDASIYKTLTIQFGEPIGQIIPVKRQEMEVIDISNDEYDYLCAERKGERGKKGFGEMGG
jgi:dUTPase